MSESAANKNWVQVPFGAVATLINGRAYKQPEMLSAGTPILRIQNLNGGSNWYYSDLNLPDDKYCNPGDLLYAWSASFGPYRYNGPKAIFHYHIWNVVPDAGIDKAFVYYQLLRITDALRQSAHGVAMPHITKAGMEAWEIGLPPLSEQKRIAGKLDTVLTRVDACRDRLARVAPLLKRFRQSVLAAATSGRLTEDWRDINSTNSWESRELGGMIQKIEAGLNVLCEERPPNVGERGLVKISAVTWGFFNEEESKTLGPEVLVSESSRIKVGDLLISRANTLELVGACVIVHDISKTLHLSDKVLRLVVPESIKLWLLYVLRSPYGRLKIEALASGNQLSMRNLSQNNLRSIKIPVPDDSEIAEIIRRVETLFAFADHLEARLKTAQTAADRLTPALLAKAFRGELVPQDPNDEPAAELLRRLAASRDAAPKAKRGRRSATADTTP